MKDIFNRRQRFHCVNIRLVSLHSLARNGTLAAHTAQADEVTAPDASSSNP